VFALNRENYIEEPENFGFLMGGKAMVRTSYLLGS